MGKKTDAELASQKAKDYFDQGFNWAESISLSFKDYLGMDSSLIPKLATGFGGGIGRKGSLCGAFTGAVMAIGMKIGRANPKISQIHSSRLFEQAASAYGFVAVDDLEMGFCRSKQKKGIMWER